jgi:serine protease Do
MACAQVVGITTEVTYYNRFGMTSTSPVVGSGFIISSDGYILTNHHVIEEAVKGNYEVEVMLYNGDTYLAEIVGYESETSDIAVLKINAEGLNAVTMGDSNAMRVGRDVYAVGNPLGELAYSMTDGMISALDREITTTDKNTGRTTTVNMFQISAAVNSGNSGGPVYNDAGEVIGVVTAKYSSTGVEGLGFAIPINDAMAIAKDLMEIGYVRGKPYMGITVQTVSSTVAQYYNMVEGAYVYSVEPGSPAEAAGLRMGDIITKLNDTDIRSTADLTNTQKNYRAGETVTLTVYRSSEYMEIQLTFGEKVPEGAVVQQTAFMQ